MDPFLEETIQTVKEAGIVGIAGLLVSVLLIWFFCCAVIIIFS